MSQVLRLKTEKKRLTLKEMETFVRVAKEYGIPMSETVGVATAKSEIVFTRALPLKVRVVDGQKVVLRPKTRKQKAVAKQISDHKGDEKKEGYVPPVGRKTAPKQRKVKCPDCNVRKPVVKVAGAGSSIKPHVSKGEPCPGSGRQVLGDKVK